MSKDLVTVITCTGFRKEAFKLCYEYMQEQTYKGKIQWIVINDEKTGEEIEVLAEKFEDKFELYKAPIKWVEGLNTQRANMLYAMEKIKGSKILFFEDDDYYRPDYIKEMVKLLDYAPIVGASNTKYYHLGMPGWKEHRNYTHSSLCQTGIQASQLPLLREALNSGNKYFDIELWKLAIEKHVPMLLLAEVDLCIGIKGLPGRKGIGAGHKTKGYFLDINLTKMKELLGEKASNYSMYIKEEWKEPTDERIKRQRTSTVLSRKQSTMQQRKQRNTGAVSDSAVRAAGAK